MKLSDTMFALGNSLKPWLLVLLGVSCALTGYYVAQAVYERATARAWIKTHEQLQKTDHAIARRTPHGCDDVFKRLYRNAP